MTSTSSDGSSVIVLQFSLNLNIDVAEQEVQAAINAAQGYLPTDLPVPPVYSKSNPADAPVLTLALTSKAFRSRGSKTWSTPAWRPRSRNSAGSAWSPSAADRNLPSAFRPTPWRCASYGVNLEDLRNALYRRTA